MLIFIYDMQGLFSMGNICQSFILVAQFHLVWALLPKSFPADNWVNVICGLLIQPKVAHQQFSVPFLVFDTHIFVVQAWNLNTLWAD